MFKLKQLSKIGRNWVFSLIIGFLLVFILLLGFSQYLGLRMQEDRIAESVTKTDLLQMNIDQSLLEVENIAAELMVNNQNLYLQSAPTEDAFSSGTSYRLNELISNIQTSNSLVKDIFIYYPKYDHIVGANGNYNAKNYYTLCHKLSAEGYDVWKEKVIYSDCREFFFQKDASEESTLTFRQIMPVNHESDPSGILIITIEKDEMERLLSLAISGDAATTIMIFDEAGNIYQNVSNNSSKEFDVSYGKELVEHDSHLPFCQYGYIGWIRPSRCGALSYAVLTDQALLLKGVHTLIRFLLGAIVFCTLLGIGCSLVFSFRHHRSIENIISQLESSTGSEEMDYKAFEEKINDLILNSKNLKKVNEKMIWSVKENVLEDILLKQMVDSVSIKNLFEVAGVTLDYIYFCIVVFQLEVPVDEMTARDKIYEMGKELESLDATIDVIPTYTDRNLIFLLNYDAKDPKEENPIKVLSDLCDKKITLPYMMVSSELFMDVSQIVPIYEFLSIELQKKKNATLGITIQDDEKESRKKDGIIAYERFQKALSLRVYQDAISIVSELFSKYIRESEDNYICLSRQYAVIHRVLQCATIEEEHYSANLKEQALKLLKQDPGMQNLEHNIEEILCLLDHPANQTSLSQKEQLAIEIKKLVDKHYNQQYLGLYYLSEQVGFSTSYVSKVFKEYYHIGIVEYVNMARIEAAKKLLDTETMTIKAIAEQVGFTSDIHFIRIFKKYENTTPGAYKNQQKI